MLTGVAGSPQGVRKTPEVLSGQVKLGEEFLISNLFTVAEEELARLALARLDGKALRVVVRGLGS